MTNGLESMTRLRKTLTDARDLLERAVAHSGLSLRSFAETVMVRDERTVRRWRAGDVPIPAVCIRKLEQYVRE